MCGIAGKISVTPIQNIDPILSSARSVHSRRGPDDFGHRALADNRVLFMHNRLSLVDMSKAGHQPMTKHGRTLVFNGEIYNFRELRSKLESCGYKFTSKTDTEVILSAYDFWGESCFNYFNGPFSLALYDNGENKVILARDRVGEKPLYYFQDGARKEFFFSSTIQFITKSNSNKNWELDTERVISDLVFNFWSDKTRTHIKDIGTLAPGHYIRIDLVDLSIQVKQYWDVTNRETESSIQESVATIRELLADSVEIRTKLDTEIGSILSGGIDSSYLTLLANKELENPLNTFTLCVKGHIDEDLYHAAKLCEEYRLQHNKVYIRQQDITLDTLRSVTRAMEEPALDHIFIYINRNYEEVHKKNIKAVLNGQGSDELFLGYLDYYPFLRDKSNYKNIESFIKYWEAKSQILDFKNVELVNNVITNNLTRNFLPYQSSDTLNSVLRFGLKTHLPALLMQEDKQSMAWSVECRTAFTDYRLIEYVSALPSQMKMQDNKEKYLLRMAAENIVPKHIVHRRKLGFPELPDNRSALVSAALKQEVFNQSKIITSIFTNSMLKYLDELPLGFQWKLLSIVLMEESLRES